MALSSYRFPGDQGIEIGKSRYLYVEEDPRVSGLDADMGSLCIFYNTSTEEVFFLKKTTTDLTGWTINDAGAGKPNGYAPLDSSGLLLQNQLPVNGEFTSLLVTGDLTVEGTETIVNTETLSIDDNFITLNSNQTGTPPSNLISGVVVERGDLINYRFVFRETDGYFAVGEVGSEQAVATREDVPTSNTIFYWDDSLNRLNSSEIYYNLNNSGSLGVGLTDTGTYRLGVSGDANITGKLDVAGVITSNSSNVLTQADEGHTNGIDSDTLDGQHYTDIQTWVNDNADVPNADYADNAGLLDNLDSTQFLRSDASDTMDAGTSTILTILSDDTGKSEIALYGAAQGTGRVYVGQDDADGGGIEYNGDGTPSTTGAGSDYITLFRRSSGTEYWTARNMHNSNTWEFRENIDIGGQLLMSGVRRDAQWNTAYTHSQVVTGNPHSLSTNDVPEDTNLYFTTARVDSHLSGGTGINYSSGTISIDSTVATADDYVKNTGDTINGTLIVNDNLQIGEDGINGNRELKMWAENGYEAKLVTFETATHGMGLRYNATDNILYIDRYPNTTTPNPLAKFYRDVDEVDFVTATLNYNGNKIATETWVTNNFNDYSHPTHPGDDFSVDTTALSGATVVSDIDINVTTDTLGHVTDANGVVSTRELTLGDLGYTGATDANNYSLEVHDNTYHSSNYYSSGDSPTFGVLTLGNYESGQSTTDGAFWHDASAGFYGYSSNNGGEALLWDNNNVSAGTDIGISTAAEGHPTISVSSSVSSTGDSIVKRDADGDINVRLVTSTYGTTNSNIAAIYTTQTIGGDYMRPSTPSQVADAIKPHLGESTSFGNYEIAYNSTDDTLDFNYIG